MEEDLSEEDLRRMMESPGTELADPRHQPTKPEGFGPEREHDETADPADARTQGRRRVHFDTGGGMPNHWHPNSPLHTESDDDLL
ncbi:hypothetical protein CMI47_06615 [Candidatus Pacearchaeota archaeon]|jgi:hypothetical protein|nr:hypothetical protein [Candidatus Pacearchaeota archaeon]|tara:strand:- start:522 stop:776 length:255 start_codon:yes stop_codon:yes gene_type:complete